jgi:hypothetical protein
MRDYETLIGPWTVYIDMRAEDIANEDADVV